MTSRKDVKLVTNICLYLFMITISLVFLFPYIWMLSNSFRTTEQLVSKPLAIFSGSFTLQSYKNIMSLGGKTILLYISNSLIITTASVLLALVTSSLGAYALTRKPNLPGFKAVMFLFLVSIMYPWALLVIPIYMVMLKLGLMGTHIGVILAITGGTSIALPVFIFQQFFKSIPYELIECAEVEGANELTILTKIVIPIAKPVYGTVALITFMFNWGEWFYVMVLSNSLKTATLPVALLNTYGELGADINAIMALASLISVPIIILFIFTQRNVMEGIAQGSIKG